MSRKKVPEVSSHTLDIAESWSRERPDLDPADFLHLILVMRLGRALERADEQFVRENYGISAADMRVLFALRRAGPPFERRPTDLFRALLVTSGGITKQVDRLTSLGFVTRQRDPEDSGGFLVQLTEKGIEAADTAISSHARSQNHAVNHGNLTRAERRKLFELSQKFLLQIEKHSSRDNQ
jgi:DNA-binding MarR family transcriptional regulator